jgi:hypothetical protein
MTMRYSGPNFGLHFVILRFQFLSKLFWKDICHNSELIGILRRICFQKHVQEYYYVQNAYK